MLEAATLERLFRRDRAITALGLGAIAALAWLYTMMIASMSSGGMGGAASQMAMPQGQPWRGIDFLLMFVLWIVMMVAMMLPSAAPMVLVFVNANRKRHEAHDPYLQTALFASAYLVVWIGFAVIATLANWALHGNGLMTSMMGTALPLWGAAFLIVAAWIALLAAFVLAEKLASSGPWLSRVSGLLLLGWGIWIAGSSFPH